MNNGKQKHTPGPWKHGGPTILSGGAWNLVVAILPTTIDPRPTADAAAHTIEEREANARLIAAAPDMLAALNRCKNHLAFVLEGIARGHGGEIPIDGAAVTGGREAVESAKAAIAKAQGRIL
jgi:hypothetical protein